MDERMRVHLVPIKQKKNAASSLLTIFREDECWKKDPTERQSACLY